jgi:hypothetical protein
MLPLHVGGHETLFRPAYAGFVVGLVVLVGSVLLERSRLDDRPRLVDAGVFLGLGLLLAATVAVVVV